MAFRSDIFQSVSIYLIDVRLNPLIRGMVVKVTVFVAFLDENGRGRVILLIFCGTRCTNARSYRVRCSAQASSAAGSNYSKSVHSSSGRVTAIKLRKKPPLLLERVGVTTAWMQEVEQRRERLPRRIKTRQKALFDPLILTFSAIAPALLYYLHPCRHP
jgi:hypothetical protein